MNNNLSVLTQAFCIPVRSNLLIPFGILFLLIVSEIRVSKNLFLEFNKEDNNEIFPEIGFLKEREQLMNASVNTASSSPQLVVLATAEHPIIQFDKFRTGLVEPEGKQISKRK